MSMVGWVAVIFLGICVLFKIVDVLHDRWAWRKADEHARKVMEQRRR